MPETAPKLSRAEAARRNGGNSRGPTTPAGKARSAQNALKHGLTAQAFALLPGEDAEAYQELLADLTRRYRPQDALASHLVQRLASVMWRQQCADRLEAEVLTQLEQHPDPSYVGGYLPGSPRTWDAARFSAVQRQQARLDRALFRLMDELERLEPAPAEAEPANDDTERQNEPNVAPPPRPSGPLSGEVLPLTPELDALLDDPSGHAWLRFVEGRTLQPTGRSGPRVCRG
jgi:hypothetical protein